MEKPLLFFLLISVVIGVIFTLGTVLDIELLIILGVFFILIYYNLSFFLQNPLFYIHSRGSLRLEQLYFICSGIAFAVLFMLFSFLPVILIILFTFTIFDLLNLSSPEYLDMVTSGILLILALSALVMNILFLKLLKKLFLKQTGIITRKGANL